MKSPSRFPIILLLLGSLLLAASCSRAPVTPAPSPTLASPLPPALHAAVLTEGKTISGQAFQLLSGQLRQAIEDGGIQGALPYCSTIALPLTTTVAESNAVTLRRVTHKPRNPANRADAWELDLIRDFQQHAATGGPMQPLAVGTAEAGARFYAPIVITNELCLKCHGRIDHEVPIDVAALVRRQYPSDEAVGFKLGDVRGLWRIEFSSNRVATLARQPGAAPNPL